MSDIVQPPLVETQWVRARLRNANFKVIEITGMMIPLNFRGHIEGSSTLDWRRQLWGPVNREFLDKKQFETLMGRLGITNETTVVLVSLKKQFASYAFWLFKYYGHKQVYLVNGSLTSWMSQNLELVAKPVPLAKEPITKYDASEARSDIRATREYVMSKLHSKESVIVDVRSPEEFRGELSSAPGSPQEGAYCKGRIPGAIHFYFEDNTSQDERFKSITELERMYDSHGITKDKEILIYCRTGHRSTFTWFVLTRLLGYPNVRVYDGSWTEWGNLVSAPIEISS